jgi:hypothetical protein
MLAVALLNSVVEIVPPIPITQGSFRKHIMSVNLESVQGSSNVQEPLLVWINRNTGQRRGAVGDHQRPKPRFCVANAERPAVLCCFTSSKGVTSSGH